MSNLLYLKACTRTFATLTTITKSHRQSIILHHEDVLLGCRVGWCIRSRGFPAYPLREQPQLLDSIAPVVSIMCRVGTQSCAAAAVYGSRTDC